MKIDMDMIKPKLLYFLFMSIISSLLLYLNMYLFQKGLNEVEIGVIDMVCYISGFFLRPVCGMLADHYRAYRSVLLTLTLLTAIGFGSLLLLPEIAKPESLAFTVLETDYDLKSMQLCHSVAGSSANDNNTKLLVNMPQNLCSCLPQNVGANVSPVLSLSEYKGNRCALYNWNNRTALTWDASVVNVTCQVCRGKLPTVSWSPTFLLALLFKTVGIAAYSPTLCLVDAVTFSLLGSRHSLYGWNRMFGSLGFFIMAIVTGFALYGSSSAWSMKTDYVPSFGLATGLLAIAGVVIMLLKVPLTARVQNPLKALPMVCSSWRNVTFYLLVLMAGSCAGVFETFLAVIVRKTLKPPSFYFGILFAVQVVVEAPCFVLSGPLVVKIGEPACLVIGFLAYSLRFALTSWVSNHWVLLPVNALHGVCFGLMFPALLTFAARSAPDGWQGTVQGLASGLYFGVGQSLSAPTSGALIHALGSHAALRVWAAMSLGFASLAFGYLLALQLWPQHPAAAASVRWETPAEVKQLDGVAGKAGDGTTATDCADPDAGSAAVAMLTKP